MAGSALSREGATSVPAVLACFFFTPSLSQEQSQDKEGGLASHPVHTQHSQGCVV